MIFRKNAGLGWIPNELDNRDFDFDKLGLSIPPPHLIEKLSLRDFAGPVFDQGKTASCVSQAIAGAIVIREARAGLPARVPSRLFVYHNARRYRGATKIDGGTVIRDAFEGLKWYGAPDEQVFPFSTSVLKVNRQPPWEAYNLAFGRRGGSYYLIRDRGEARLSAIRAALFDGLPVVFGTAVSKSFLAFHGPEVIEEPASSDPKAGGHAMLITGIQAGPSGRFFEVRNSWGEAWRAGGYCLFSESYVRSDAVRDLTVVSGWARLQK